jgi:hypothetical protein
MVNAPHLVAPVRAGALFVNGKLVERPGDQGQQGVIDKRHEHADPQAGRLAEAQRRERQSAGTVKTPRKWPGVRGLRCLTY